MIVVIFYLNFIFSKNFYIIFVTGLQDGLFFIAAIFCYVQFLNHKAMHLQEEIINIISTLFKIPSNEILMESHLEHDLGLDSLDMVEIAMECEENFNISISDLDVQEINYVGDIFKVIDKELLLKK
jgi:acyl carrier protein